MAKPPIQVRALVREGNSVITEVRGGATLPVYVRLPDGREMPIIATERAIGGAPGARRLVVVAEYPDAG